MKKKFNEVYSGHEILLIMQFADNYNRFIKRIIRQNADNAAHVIDFGAGIGAFAHSTRVWAQKLICIEPDHKQKSILEDDKLNVESSLSPISENSIDFVYTINVLEHIKNDFTSIQEIYKILRPGGKLLIYVPALPWLYSNMDARVGHFRRYSMKDLLNKTIAAGFEVKQSEYVDCLGVLATLIYKLIGNSNGSFSLKSLIIYDKLVFPISRIVDKFLNKFVGKNILVICEKPHY